MSFTRSFAIGFGRLVLGRPAETEPCYCSAQLLQRCANGTIWPLASGGMSGVSAEYLEFEPIPPPLRPNWRPRRMCAVIKTHTHMFLAGKHLQVLIRGLDSHGTSLLDCGFVSSYPSFPLRFRRCHRLNLQFPSDRDVLNEARLMPIYGTGAAYRPIMWAQWGDFHPVYGCL